MTHFKIDIKINNEEWIICDDSHEIFKTRNDGIVYKLINEEEQTKTFPDVYRYIIVKTKNNNIYRTIFLSEFERKNVIMKWKIKEYYYEQ